VYRPGAQQGRQLRQVDKPLRVPGGPVIVGPVDDPENTMVSLARLMQQAADLLKCVRHVMPPRLDDGPPSDRPCHLVWRNGHALTADPSSIRHTERVMRVHALSLGEKRWPSLSKDVGHYLSHARCLVVVASTSDGGRSTNAVSYLMSGSGGFLWVWFLTNSQAKHSSH
jgi:hypothetical protein